jgi:predicted lactoylglutathione lyase
MTMSTATNTKAALKAKTVMANLTVNALQTSLSFFEGLGFGIEEQWEDKGKLTGVMLRAGDAQIGLMQDDWQKGRNRLKGVGTRLFIGTSQNIDEIAARAEDAGIALDSKPHDTEWGSRAFDLTEPSGFKITISSDV